MVQVGNICAEIFVKRAVWCGLGAC